ncbi:GIY-YIG nuclease family protein [Reyranella sp.]|uniref:GIY-YIG nuclease family protein n=1 Tax=Reyranella sp. TaxID=1929291 RepID=UPI003BA90A8E
MTNTLAGRSLELFFIDGKPDGMLTAEVFNWTGHVLVTPRIQLGDALRRKEAQYTGVYLLLGEKDGAPFAYIGEAEDVSERIRSHDARKDWWTQVVLITSAANNLNKAHVKYLEARLVEQARAAGKAVLENGNTPPRSSLTEAAQANMEVFLDYVMLVLPALRIDIFLRNTRPTPEASLQTPTVNVPTFELRSGLHGLYATAQLLNGEFVVQAGSRARAVWSEASRDHSYAQLHAELIRAGVLVEQDGYLVFAANYAFRSPSAAAAVIFGRPANGQNDWKVQGQSITYRQWEEEALASSAPV